MRTAPTPSAIEPAPALARDLADALRGWYFTHRRRLPWREDPTPYRVWVSEIMLQQTQVATVIPYFERFLEAFPDVHALAAAAEDAVLARWSGLGYYRRARHLHAAAKEVVARFGGAIPGTVDGLLTLPGVGRYTAGAVASIAFGQRAPVLDGNVARVLARVFAVEEAADSHPGLKRLWALAEALVPTDPSSHNQALMELGALVCSPRAPDCARCPLADRCAAHGLGRAEDFPRTDKKVVVKDVHAVAALVRRHAGSDEVLLAKRPRDVLLGGLWELPGAELASPRAARKKALSAALSERAGLDATIGEQVATVEHQFTHRRLSLEIFLASAPHPPGPPTALAFYERLTWTSPAAADTDDSATPLSTLTRKVFRAVRGQGIA